MDEAQQQVVLLEGVLGGDVARQAQQHLVARVQPVAHFEAELGVALVGVVEGAAIELQLAAVGVDQAQGAVGAGVKS